jgi:ABC-type Fe3+ transport system substrate-binding protein
MLQGLGVVAGSGHCKPARLFAQFLLGAEGQGVLAAFGFDRPPEPAR